jgi:hypothetical protein
MNTELKLRRKWTLRAHGRQMVFIKKPLESGMHVLTKAFIWALYLPDYPNLCVEIPVVGRYKPDVVQFDDTGEPVFWGEAGQVSRRKIQALIQRHLSAHLVFAKWDLDLAPLHRIVKREMGADCRRAPIDLISLPAQSDRRFIQTDGTIQISFKEVRHVRC